MTLSELTQKYGLRGAKYEPNPDCKFCKGTGEKPLKRKRHNILTGEELPDTHTFCICLYVDHSASNEIGGMLGSFAKKQLEKMEHETE